VTGVVFDFGNVLYRVDYPAMARELAGERAEALLSAFVGSPLQVAYETGRADLADVLRALAGLDFPVTRERFLDAYLGIFSPVPGSRELVARLAEVAPLGLLSNTSAEHARLFIERTPEFPLFQAAAYSFEMGWMKPDRRAYVEISRRLGVPPSELVYTDDVEEFAAAAGEAGMTGVPFRSADDLSRQLTGLGLPAPSDLA